MSSAAQYFHPAYIGIGSNLDSPESQVRSAVDELGSLPDTIVTGASSLYQSAPFGPVEQGDFVNAVVALLTRLSAHELLSQLQVIENNHSRNRDVERWGPRTLDLDLLVFSEQRINDDVLTVPHPGISERNFVLLPLCELAPHLIVPGLGSVEMLAAGACTSGGRIEKISSIAEEVSN